MCGIIGISSNKSMKIIEYTYEALKKLEYRGYDSCGIAFIKDKNIDICVTKKAGNVNNLKQYLDFSEEGTCSIAHTRWATHGAVTDYNAHPFVFENYAMVLNGIVENYEDIKSDLVAKGYEFTSDTDAEVLLVYLVKQIKEIGWMEVFKKVKKEANGNFSFVFMDLKEKHILGMKRGLQLILGQAKEFSMVASDKYAFPLEVERYIPLNNGEAFLLKGSEITIFDENMKNVPRGTFLYEYDNESTDKQGFETFMLKEIYEQPIVAKKMISKYVDLSAKKVINHEFSEFVARDVRSIHIVACGSSYYAGIQFKQWCRKYFDIFVEVSIASEFVFFEHVDSFDLYIFISQSGETKDTLLCAEKLSGFKEKLVSITNVEGSTLSSLCSINLPIYAGKEIGVASTKAFFNQIMLLFLYVIIKSGNWGCLKNILFSLDVLESEISRCTVSNNVIDSIALAKKIILSSRGDLFPISLEVALKMKELSYLQVESIPSGEMKHGSISLVDESTVIIFFVNSNSESYSKTLVNINEVLLRGAQIIAIVDDSAEKDLKNKVKHTILVNTNKIDSFVFPFFYLIEGQKIAYLLAKHLGNNIDMPRNLAKSVTVE